MHHLRGRADGAPRWLLALAALGAMTCGPEAPDHPPFERQWSSEHFDYSSRTGDDVCEDVLLTLESHLGVLHAYLGLAWPAGRRIRYEKYADATDFAANSDCAAGSEGCFAEGTVRTWRRVDEHELAHADVSHLPRPPPLLEEGLAEALSCGVRPRPRPAIGWREAMSTPSSLELYHTGSWLVGSLLRAHGPEPLMRLYASVPAGADADALAAAFSTIYGLSLDAAWSQAIASDDPAVACASVWQCAAPPLVLGSGPVTPERACAVDIAWSTFALGAASPVTWRTDGEWSAQVGSCSDGGAPQTAAQRVAGAAGHLGLTTLAAGAYFIGHHGPGALSVTTDAPAWTGAACEALDPYPLPATPDRVQLDVPQDGSTSFAAVVLPAPATVVVEVVESPASAYVQVCPSCTAPVEACTMFAAGARVGFVEAQGLVFRVDTVPAADRFTTLLISPP